VEVLHLGREIEHGVPDALESRRALGGGRVRLDEKLVRQDPERPVFALGQEEAPHRRYLLHPFPVHPTVTGRDFDVRLAGDVGEAEPAEECKVRTVLVGEDHRPLLLGRCDLDLRLERAALVDRHRHPDHRRGQPGVQLEQ